MAEILTDPDDEIIFVDYNTPDDFPTFPEAIQDTLTAKARAALRILRVRPSQHERFQDKTHLVCLEPIARNVGIRRSNPTNRWILSTNTDMVFYPRNNKSLSEIVSSLPDAYYHLPRFEVPESLWEGANRMDPDGTISSFGTWGRELHLNEIVYTSLSDVRYDGPGDFQLMLRSDIWNIHGFHESMLVGWHVDSNIARRLSLIPRALGDVVDELYGYHCDHTRQVTPAHKARGIQNDQKIYYENVTGADVRAQSKTWGLADEIVEEIRVDPTGNTYLVALQSAIDAPLDKPTTTGYSSTSFNHLDYPIEHVAPFLADSLASYPRDTVLGWSGAKRSLLRRFARVWKALGFSAPIMVFADAKWLGPDLPVNCVWMPWEEAIERATVFVFDWGKPDEGPPLAEWLFQNDPIIQHVTRDFRRAVRSERYRVERNPSAARRFIGINAICNSVEGVFNNNVGAALTPLATHIRQGFLNATPSDELLSALYIGQAGNRMPRAIVTLPKIEGYVFYGPYLDLDPGAFRFTVEFDDVKYTSRSPATLVLEVVASARLIAYREILRKDLADGTVSLDFNISPEIGNAGDWPRIEFRLKTSGSISLAVRNAFLDELEMDQAHFEGLREFDCAPLLSIGPAGTAGGSPANSERRAIHAKRGVNDLLVFGPHFWLESGHYEVTFEFDVSRPNADSSIRVYVASHLGKRILGSGVAEPGKRGIASCTVAFDIPNETPAAELGLLEFLVWSDGRPRFSLLSARVKYVRHLTAATRPDIEPRDLLAMLPTGRGGKTVPGKIVSVVGAYGAVFFGPYLDLKPGSYRVCVALKPSGAQNPDASPGLSLAVVSDAGILAFHQITAQELDLGSVEMFFSSPEERGCRRTEFVLRTTGHVAVEVSSVVFEEIGGSIPGGIAQSTDLLPMLEIHEAAKWERAPGKSDQLRSPFGAGGIMAYGPYVALLPGDYEVDFDAVFRGCLPNTTIRVDVATDLGQNILAQGRLVPTQVLGTGSARATLKFSVNGSVSSSQTARYEFRVWSSRKADVILTGVRLRRTTSYSGVAATTAALP
ncbi:MAG TPA: hypothetical protein VGG22_06315 [Candidatus Baltobacteraceae bacterium]